MNKSDLISTISESTGLSLAKAEKALSATIDTIVQTLVQRDSISLIGFGRFGVKKRAERTVRNPKTGEKMLIASDLVPFFKAGKGLKEQVDIDQK